MNCAVDTSSVMGLSYIYIHTHTHTHTHTFSLTARRQRSHTSLYPESDDSSQNPTTTCDVELQVKLHSLNSKKWSRDGLSEPEGLSCDFILCLSARAFLAPPVFLIDIPGSVLLVMVWSHRQNRPIIRRHSSVTRWSCSLTDAMDTAINTYGGETEYYYYWEVWWCKICNCATGILCTYCILQVDGRFCAVLELNKPKLLASWIKSLALRPSQNLSVTYISYCTIDN